MSVERSKKKRDEINGSTHMQWAGQWLYGLATRFLVRTFAAVRIETCRRTNGVAKPGEGCPGAHLCGGLWKHEHGASKAPGGCGRRYPRRNGGLGMRFAQIWCCEWLRNANVITRADYRPALDFVV
jgi:hypothetical protein